MPASLYLYAVAVGGILGLLAMWLVVQRAWGQVFAVDGDVLAARGGCGRCGQGGGCTTAGRCAGSNDTTAAAAGGPDETTPRDKAG